MPQYIALSITIALFVLSGVAFWYFAFHLDLESMWLAIGLPMLVFIIALGSLFWSIDDNYYHVESGVVVSQDFTAGHYALVGKVLIWQDDDWAIQVREDDGTTGWFHYDYDVFATYPIGSDYP